MTALFPCVARAVQSRDRGDLVVPEPLVFAKHHDLPERLTECQERLLHEARPLGREGVPLGAAGGGV